MDYFRIKSNNLIIINQKNNNKIQKLVKSYYIFNKNILLRDKINHIYSI